MLCAARLEKKYAKICANIKTQIIVNVSSNHFWYLWSSHMSLAFSSSLHCGEIQSMPRQVIVFKILYFIFLISFLLTLARWLIQLKQEVSSYRRKEAFKARKLWQLPYHLVPYDVLHLLLILFVHDIFTPAEDKCLKNIV